MATEPGAHAHAPGQTTIGRRAGFEALRFGLPGRDAGIEPVQYVVFAVGYRPQRISAPGHSGQIAAAHAPARDARSTASARAPVRWPRAVPKPDSAAPAHGGSNQHLRQVAPDSSQLLRSPARFLASSISMTSRVPSKSSRVSCTSRRVLGSMVVSRSCGGFISPSPLKRVTCGLPRRFSATSRSRMPSRSASSSA